MQWLPAIPLYLHKIKQPFRNQVQQTDIFDSAFACQTSSPMVADYLFPHSICLSKTFLLTRSTTDPKNRQINRIQQKLISVRARERETYHKQQGKREHISPPYQNHAHEERKINTPSIQKDNSTIIIQTKAM